jgi:uncharacterized membrane protein
MSDDPSLRNQPPSSADPSPTQPPSPAKKSRRQQRTPFHSWDLLIVFLSALALLILIALEQQQMILLVAGQSLTSPLGEERYIVPLNEQQLLLVKFLRAVIGLAHTIYLPGYCLVAALFPGKDDLDTVTRVALSFGTSVAVLPLMTLIIGMAPEWKITLLPMAQLLMLWTIGIGGIAVIQRWRSARVGEAYTPPRLIGPEWWKRVPLVRRLTLGFLGLTLVSLVVFVTVTWIVPALRTDITEFYIIGDAGFLYGYPTTATLGEELTVTVGVTNKERSERTYRLEVWVADMETPTRREHVRTVEPFTLNPGQNREGALSWEMPWPGGEQKIEMLLFIEGQEKPYRRLHFFINEVTEHVPLQR